MKRSAVYFCVLFTALGFFSFSHAQMSDTERNNWLLGVIFKLETMKEKAAAEILKYENEIAKCDSRISSSEKILKLARQAANTQAEAVAGEAMSKAQAARMLNRKNKISAELNKKRAENALAYIKTGGKNVEATLEQVEFENEHSEWKRRQNQLIDQRLAEPNRTAGAICRSLKSNVPPLPGKNFKDLQPGDVVLLAGNSGGSKLVAAADSDLTSGANVSITSHTVIYLKEVNGKKLFLDNQPFQGPRIITEDEFLKVYGNRGAEVARLAEPLNAEEGKRLFSEAVKMAQENRKEVAKNWFGTPLLGTNYGAWGKDDVVCSEADWVLINNAGRKIPQTADQTKADSGVHFSPADYVNSPYFIVTPLGIPK
ncbi:MAG: hypothetical protein C4519_06820 [Desulfobacteraceae bacterium]|nr:MAG: hypothetical protein C4519_06820 [Desulfobacteraceae bacterium]